MLFEKIDRDTWARKEYFEHYFSNVPCTYSMTVKLDITKKGSDRLSYIRLCFIILPPL